MVDVKTPHARLIAGAPLDLLVSARLGGARVDQLGGRATVTSPGIGVEALRRRHAQELDALRATLPAGDDDPSARALLELDRRHAGELLRRRSSLVALRPYHDGLRARVTTVAPGSYCARVLVRGRVGGQAFERLALVCAAVD